MLSLCLTFAAVILTPLGSLQSSRMCSCSQPSMLIDFREPIHQFNLVDHPPGLLFTVKGNSIKSQKCD